ncbi:hypothetical protein MBLNU459_g1723t1 [Dothideomycetes sp. NU459]
MNHEPSASAAGEIDNPVSRQDDDAPARQTLQERRRRNKTLFNARRTVFLVDLIRQIDLLVYVELAAIYYMDCSFARLLIRAAFVQFLFLSPKPSFLPEPPQNRPYLGAIFGTNLLCLFLHLVLDPPEASEATRGYLHGGLAMDFVGQKGPTSKIHLILLDLLVLGLQLAQLTAHVTRLKVKKQPSASSTAAPATPATPAQDHDFEERGLHRSDHEPVDIELQNLNPAGRQAEPASVETARDANNEREALLAADTAPRSDAHIFDAFNSGEIMIADLDIPNIVRSQLLEYRNAPRETSDPGASISDRLTASGLGFRIRIGNRILGV